ncbi:hypothetical protein V6N11_046668 [Hibiscus sabdariffa]|uniref:Uncharacterized protein n=1 Tax=Hibiscus sabdariffa TaxID=183260 RepID=A0ABR2P3C4_9ROSI
MEGREEAAGTKFGDGGVNTAGFVCTCAGHSSAEGGGASHALKQTSDSQADELELIDEIAKLRHVLAANEAVSQNGDKHQGDQGVCVQEDVGVEDSAVGVGNTGDDLEDTDDGAECEQLSTCQGLDQSEEVETAEGDQVSSDGAECEQLVLEEGLSQIDIRCAGDVMTDTYQEESALEGADVVSSARQIDLADSAECVGVQEEQHMDLGVFT